MTYLRQLYDPRTATSYTVDRQNMVLRLDFDGNTQQTRLKPAFAALLAALFFRHPGVVPYKTLIALLTESNLSCPDETRLHRKISDLKAFLKSFAPKTEDIICNVRGVGYSLSLSLKEPAIEASDLTQTLQNPLLKDALQHIQELLAAALQLGQTCPLIKIEEGFILQRKAVHQDIDKLLVQFETQKARLFKALHHHAADFVWMRIELALAKLKTYIGLVRISDFAITKKQWADWDANETKRVFGELVHFVKQADQGP
ncbi:MAG: hypothetical protein ACPG7U_00045 [Holosporaceae bacterium]